MISLKACAATTVSPSIRINEWGMVPLGSSPRISALFTTATPSQPPKNALRSIMGASVGCIRRAPKLTTGWSPAAFLHRAALVATPEAWQSNPKSAVSYWAKSTYRPSMVSTGCIVPKTVPSGKAWTVTGRSRSSAATSSMPVKTPHPQPAGKLFSTTSVTTRFVIPFCRRISRVRIK